MEGDEIGPLDSTSCSEWFFGPSECPGIYFVRNHNLFDAIAVEAGPGCHGLNNCSSCAGTEDCAWCAAEQLCITVAEVFAGNEETCRGAVFNSPCPASFVGGKLTLFLDAF
jgi:hypothetical protein